MESTKEHINPTCPQCKSIISLNAILAYRPFPCPQCKEFLNAEIDERPHAGIGCLSTLVLGTLLFIALGLHWALGIGLGVALAILVMLFIFPRLVPNRPIIPPRLRVHELRSAPEDLVELANLLETLAATDMWQSEFDKEIDKLARTSSFWDDALFGAAIGAAENFRKLLQGLPVPARRHEPVRSLREQREELRAIARDVRIAAESQGN